jgi:hypothetical protein
LPQQPILKHPQPTFLLDFQTGVVAHPYKTSEVMNNNNNNNNNINNNNGITTFCPHYLLFLAVTYDTFLLPRLFGRVYFRQDISDHGHIHNTCRNINSKKQILKKYTLLANVR